MTTNTSLIPGQYYHIYNRGNNGQDAFFEGRNYRYFLKLYARYIEPVAETFAYCLLKNHFHFLLRIQMDEERLAKIGAVSETAPISPLKPPSRHFNNMFIAYTKAINKAYQRTGSLLEKPFRRKLVESDRYFMQLIIYIHRNPQKHGFVDDFRDWPWSSYRTLITTYPTRLKRLSVMDWFGGSDNFVEAHRVKVNQVDIESLIEDDWV